MERGGLVMRPVLKLGLWTLVVLVGGAFYLSKGGLRIEPEPTTKGGEETVSDRGIPEFPWPPPRASAFAKIPNELIAGGAKEPLLGDIASRLEQAFDAAGYAERSYHSVPNGFALVSRIEQIRADGTPKEEPGRWSVLSLRPKVVSLRDYIEALFKAPRGRYRVIVFIVTDLALTQEKKEPTRTEAMEWLSSGALSLPRAIAARAYSSAYYTTALIYEFERGADGEGAAFLKIPSELQGKRHLERAGIWSKLGM
ncbi:MAG: hypothetical protein ACREYF_29300 [Gammaproteobacteria bacterium]